MKMSKILSLVLAVLMVVACFTACGTPDNPDTNADLAGTYDITMWVSEKEGVADQFKAQIKAFEAANPGIKIEASIEGVSEANSATQVLADVATAPDIYCFAQDQLARLVQAKALAKHGKGAAETIKTNNDAGSVAAATVAGEIYAYPMTSDNGFYMYYDKSIITEEEAESLDEVRAEIADDTAESIKAELAAFRGEMETLIAQRVAAKKEKNFALADEIRNKLLDMGIVLEDTRQGTKWKRV